VTSRPALSKRELEIARVLWRLGEATPRQVFEAYANRSDLDFTSVQTYLRRLESKGYIAARRDGRTKHYRPCVQPRTVIRNTIDELVDRLFDGQAMPLMRHLVQDRRVTRDQIDELRRMLSQMEAEQDGRS
jgi:predicted transcriptional regulator